MSRIFSYFVAFLAILVAALSVVGVIFNYQRNNTSGILALLLLLLFSILSVWHFFKKARGSVTSLSGNDCRETTKTRRDDMRASEPGLTGHSKINNKAVSLAFIIYMASVIFLVFQLPSNILDISPMLHDLVAIFARYVPSIERTGLRSHVPQIAQTILAYEIIWIPILGYIAIRSTPIDGSIARSKKHPLRFYFLIPLVVALIIFGLFFFFPGYPDGEGWSSKIERSILTTNFGLAWWTGFFFGGGGSGLVLIVYLYLKVFPHVRGYRK